MKTITTIDQFETVLSDCHAKCGAAAECYCLTLSLCGPL